jgi:hypothetical protein
MATLVQSLALPNSVLVGPRTRTMAGDSFIWSGEARYQLPNTAIQISAEALAAASTAAVAQSIRAMLVALGQDWSTAVASTRPRIPRHRARRSSTRSAMGPRHSRCGPARQRLVEGFVSASARVGVRPPPQMARLSHFGDANDHLVPARTFGLIHGEVGASNEAVGVLPGAAKSHADADGHGDVVIARIDGFGY